MKKILFILTMHMVTSVLAQDVITLQWWCRGTLGYNRSISVDATVRLYIDDGAGGNLLSSEPAENYWTKHTYAVNAGKHLFM